MKYIARFVAVATLIISLSPLSASALTLSASAQAQLAQITSTLVQMLLQINTAASQGAAYTSSAAYQTQLDSWTQTLSQLQVSLSAIVSQVAQSQGQAYQYQNAASGSSCPNFAFNLAPGDSGDAVAQLQRFLQSDSSAQYTGSISGTYDDATQAAVERYQMAKSIAYSGSPATNGFGAVGPTTRASISASCANQTAYSQPYTQSAAASTASTGMLAAAGVSGSVVTFTVTANPSTSCGPSTFMLSFGDGQQQQVTFYSSCGSQVQTVTHTYAQSGTYNAALVSGTFVATLSVTVAGSTQYSTGSISLSNSSGPLATFTVTANPNSNCGATTYALAFGDGQQQTLNFSGSCSTQVQTITHTYSQAGNYTATLSSGPFAMNLTFTLSSTPSSTGSISIQSVSTSDTSGGTFIVTANPTTGCGASTFMLSFGDGQQQQLSFNSSCSTQTQTIYHRFSSPGNYTASLISGTFSTNLAFSIPLPGTGVPASMSISAYAGATSGTVNVPVSVTPGTYCSSFAYTVNFGDGSSQTLTFPFATSSCASMTLTASHAYTTNGTYTITVIDPQNNTQKTSFTVSNVTAAGAGDPFAVLTLYGDGTNGSTVVTDSSASRHVMAVYGNAHIDTSNIESGTGSIAFDGAGDYVTTASSTDFNYGSGDFTVDLWFKANAFPGTNQQASLIQQANSAATDASLGGAGLELFGNQLYFVGSIGGVTYHPFYNDSIHTAALSTGTWYHAAAVRSGSTVTLYLNGTSQGTLSVSGSANSSPNMLSLGRYGEYAGNYFNGNIDNVDIAKGLARWTANFDPSTLVTVTSTSNLSQCPYYGGYYQYLCTSLGYK